MNRLQITAGTFEDVGLILESATDDKSAQEYKETVDISLSLKVPKMKLDFESKTSALVSTDSGMGFFGFDIGKKKDKSKLYTVLNFGSSLDIDDSVNLRFQEYGGDDDVIFIACVQNVKTVADLKKGKFILSGSSCDIESYNNSTYQTTEMYKGISCKFKLEYQAPAGYHYVDPNLVPDEKTLKKMLLNAVGALSPIYNFEIKSFKYDQGKNKAYIKGLIEGTEQAPHGYFNRYIMKPEMNELDDDFVPYIIDGISEAEKDTGIEDLSEDFICVWDALNFFVKEFDKVYSLERKEPPTIVGDLTFK